MGTYSLSWPGFGDFPIYIIDKENGTIYSEKDPLPYERRNLNHFGHHHVLLDDVMELFSSMTMVKASIKLVLLTDNVTMYPIYKDEKTKKRYLSLDTLLAFIIVFPFCPEFQRARAAVLRFLTLYPDLTCSSCGFIQRDCRCVRTAKKPLSKTHPFDSMPEELVAKVSDLTESSAQTDKRICPICDDSESFYSSTSPWLVMPPGMKVRPGDKLPMLVLNNAKIINCSTLDDANAGDPPESKNSQAGVTLPPQPTVAHTDISNIPTVPMQMMNQPQLAALSVLPYGFSNDGSYFANQSLQSIVPQGAISPMVNFSQPFPTLPGNTYLQPLNLSGSFVNQSFGGPPAPSNMSPLAAMNNNGAPVPGSMGPPLAPAARIQMRNHSSPQLSPIENMHNLSTQFKPSKINTILAKRKQGLPGQEEVRRGRPPKKAKISSDFRMIGPARRTSLNTEEKKSEQKTGKDSEKTKVKSPSKRAEEDLEPGEIPKEVLEEIKDSVVIEYVEGAKKQKETSDGLREKDGDGEGELEKQGEDSEESSENGKRESSESPAEQVPENKEGSDSTKNKPDESKADEMSKDKPVEDETASADKDGKKEEETDKGESSEKEIAKKDSEDDGAQKSANEGSSSPVKEIGDEDGKKDAKAAVDGKDESGVEPMTTDTNEDETSDQQNKEKPLKIQSVSGVSVPAEKCKDSPYYMVSPNGNVVLHEKGFAEFEFGPTGEKMLRCILYGCGQCFDTYELAELHEKTHCARGQGLECPHCDSFKVVNTRWYHLLRHMDNAHGVKMSKTEFQCDLCGLDLENEEAFQEHHSFHHYSHYKCIHCGITLFTWNHVKHHLKECADKEKGHFYHNCPYCHIVFHGPAFQEVHVKSHRDQGLVCCYCKEEKIWDSWKHLKKHYEIFHLAKEHKRLHKCMHCKMHFSSLKKFKVHLQNRHNPDKQEEPKVPTKRKRKSSQVEEGKEEEKKGEEKPTKTAVVGKKSGRIRKKKSIDKSEWVEGDEVLSAEEEQNEDSADEGSEKNDTNVSNEEEQESEVEKDKKEEEVVEEEKVEEVVMLECPECEKKFRTKKRLDMHVERTHGEEVQCSKCDYIARNAFYLKAHVQQKHGEKEHQCSDCGKPFNHYYELKIHLAKHARNTVFTCKTCWQEFDSRANLRNHKETAHTVVASPSRQESKEGEDLSCPLCSFTASSSALLQAHQVAEHPEDGADHAYFNKASGSTAKVANVKPAKPSVSRGRAKKVVKGGKGRGRGKVGGRGGAAAVVGNTGRRGRKDKMKERKIKDKLIKERMIRKLKRSTCARTRSIDEHRAIKAQENEENVTIDESAKPHTSSRPPPQKGRSGKKYQQVPQPSRPTSSLWSDFEITPIAPSSEDIAKVRSVEMDHSYYHSTSQDIISIRNQLRDARASISEDDAWAPEPTGYEECLTSPSGQQSKGKQQSPPHLKTVLKDGPGQLQSLHGSHRVERQQPVASSSMESTEDQDVSNNSQNDSLGDLENLIQGDMSDIMLAAEQYLQDSSLMNDSLEGIGSPNTSSDFFLQDPETVASGMDSPQVSLPSSPVKKPVSLQSFGSGGLSPLKNSPRKKVVVQAANRQVFTLQRLNANNSQTDNSDDVMSSAGLVSDNEDHPDESQISSSVTEDAMSDGLTLNSTSGDAVSTNSQFSQLDYLQTPTSIGSLPDDILQSPEYSSPANDSEMNISTASCDGPDTNEPLEAGTSTPKSSLGESVQLSSSQGNVSSPDCSHENKSLPDVQSNTNSAANPPTKTVVKLNANTPLRNQQSQPGATKTFLLPTRRTVVPQTKVISPARNEAKKTVVIQSTSDGRRTVLLPSQSDSKEQKLVVRSPGAVGNMKSVFQDVQGLSGVAPGSKVKVIRVIQTPSTKTSLATTSTGQTQRILIPRSNVLTKTVQRPSTSSMAASKTILSKPESEVEEAVRSISEGKSMVDELNETLFSNISDGAE